MVTVTATKPQGFISRVEALVLSAVLFGINGKCPQNIREIAQHIGVDEDSVREYVSQGSQAHLGFAFLGWADLSDCDPIVFQLLDRLRKYPKRLTSTDIGNMIRKFREETCFGLDKPPVLPTNRQKKREKPTIKKDSLRSGWPKKWQEEIAPVPLDGMVADIIKRMKQRINEIVVVPGGGENCDHHNWEWLIPERRAKIKWVIGKCKNKNCSATAEHL